MNAMVATELLCLQLLRHHQKQEDEGQQKHIRLENNWDTANIL